MTASFVEVLHFPGAHYEQQRVKSGCWWPAERGKISQP